MRGVIGAASEVDLYNQLQTAGMELVDCRRLSKKSVLSGGFGIKKIVIRDLIQFFIHMEQMQSAGVPLLDALSDIRDTTENQALRDVMSEIYRDVSDGASLSEAMEKHPKIFKVLFVSLIKAGEDTGDLTFSYRQLVKYLKWVDEMQSRIRKATRYPIIVCLVVLLTVAVMMGVVVPQIVGFIKTLDQELPIYTTALVATSNFFASPLFTIFGIPFYGGLVVVMLPAIVFVALKTLRKLSHNMAYRIDLMYLNMPVFGPLIRKITIARYAQTFASLFAAGIDVVRSLKSAKNTVTNIAMLEALEAVEEYVQAGSPLSESFNRSGEFPSMVVRMIKIGEESGNLTAVLEQVSEFYTKDVDEAVQGLITMIEPALTGILGGMILWIAVGVFGPIYGSFENIDF
ncbi:MAG: type II secretion system F family protein [Alphaproteobacteria bacterium]|nr:type II secretion system F family protein [Alphaproteobacteria bacterium]MCD8566576.1 type II secretion system F family protein [Alphaproteobacteria bacterium]